MTTVDLYLADKIATFISMGSAVWMALVVKWAVTNFVAGLRLKGRGFNYHPGLYYDKKKCEIANIGLFTTVIYDTESKCESSPIDNEMLTKKVIWKRNRGTDENET